jgi:hypothetical protein
MFGPGRPGHRRFPSGLLPPAAAPHPTGLGRGLPAQAWATASCQATCTTGCFMRPSGRSSVPGVPPLRRILFPPDVVVVERTGPWARAKQTEPATGSPGAPGVWGRASPPPSRSPSRGRSGQLRVGHLGAVHQTVTARTAARPSSADRRSPSCIRRRGSRPSSGAGPVGAGDDAHRSRERCRRGSRRQARRGCGSCGARGLRRAPARGERRGHQTTSPSPRRDMWKDIAGRPSSP